eukprot:gnl/MRDRNA2_/MRDRNA2_26511_c0_seq1.p1 gnl/MRDRNA2_/MRDRNA2_26511_c0~~gnl/MRDRNA2_/MRDRNA2_26511_c0_seq1.p1  ORF type:complete len:315 (-),score=28.64 gnl/MRDRNA2_/MRDRNA2_26511_c0_seq1:37-954(-)
MRLAAEVPLPETIGETPGEARDLVHPMPGLGLPSELSDITLPLLSTSGSVAGKSTVHATSCKETDSLAYTRSEAVSHLPSPQHQLAASSAVDACTQTDVGTDLMGFKCLRCDKPPAIPGDRDQIFLASLPEKLRSKQKFKSKNQNVSRVRKRNSRLRLNSYAPRFAQAFLPEFEATPDVTIAFSIEQTLLHWNVAGSDTACCSWHCALRVLNQVTTNMGLRCRMDWSPHSSLQCQFCKSLLDDDGSTACTICGGRLSRSSSDSELLKDKLRQKLNDASLSVARSEPSRVGSSDEQCGEVISLYRL